MGRFIGHARCLPFDCNVHFAKSINSRPVSVNGTINSKLALQLVHCSTYVSVTQEKVIFYLQGEERNFKSGNRETKMFITVSCKMCSKEREADVHITLGTFSAPNPLFSLLSYSQSSLRIRMGDYIEEYWVRRRGLWGGEGVFCLLY